MEYTLIIKVVIFVILALLACWPYFENLKKYHWLKTLLIGVPIVLLLLLGVMDIVNSEAQSKIDKREITRLTDTIGKMSYQVLKLSNKVVSLSDKLDDMQDDFDGKQDSMINKLNADILNNRQTLEIQNAKGHLTVASLDTASN